MTIFDQSQVGLRSNPNLLINGDFSVDQRNSFTTVPLASSTVYYQDRWIYRGVAGTGGSANVGHGRNQEGGYGYITHTSATGYGYVCQKIEASDVSHLNGKEVTFSADIRFDNNIPSQLSCFWVAVGSWTALSSTVTTNVTTSTGRETVATTFTVPTITAWDVNVEYALVIRFDYGGSAAIPDGTYRFYSLKLELGSVATPFVADDPATNLAKCQRYYFSSPDTLYGYMYPSSDGRSRFHDYHFPHMRIVPDCDVTVTSGAISAPVNSYKSNTFCQVLVNGDLATSGTVTIDFTADAEL